MTMAGSNQNIRKGNVTPGCAIGRTLLATLPPRQKFITKSRARLASRRPINLAGPDTGCCIQRDWIGIVENCVWRGAESFLPALFDPITF
jgi:hypothetical protein